MSKSKRRERIRAKYSIEAFINIQYDKMQNRVAGYGHLRYKGIDLVPREVFKSWAREQSNLYPLFHSWARSGYELRQRPTIDRLDSSKGYLLDNMRWLSHSENSILGNISKKGR